jgi:hypothetical protein
MPRLSKQQLYLFTTKLIDAVSLKGKRRKGNVEKTKGARHDGTPERW